MINSFLDNLPDALRSQVEPIITALPKSKAVLEELYQYALQESDNSRRKISKTSVDIDSTFFECVQEENIIFKLKDVTVLSPLRKKSNIILHISNKTNKPMLSLMNENTPTMTITNLKINIKMATFLPVPEKNNIFYMFINYKKSVNDKFSEPILITINKESILEQFLASGLLESDDQDFTRCIEYMRKQAILTGFRISDPFFTSHQSSDISPSFHVEGHRGTKEGTLYFLPDHILFGFKKPILMFESNDIESITYSSITRLTFNVTLITKDDGKFEFSMIDQTEYAKIDEYVKRKQVKDRSMSNELKAKTTNKNQQVQDGEPMSALEEATQQLESDMNINAMNLDSDDEENDVNFEAESDLSDGSEDDDEDDEEEEVQDNTLYNKSNKMSTEFSLDLNELNSLPSILEDQHSTFNGFNAFQPEGFSVDLGLDDIPIEIEDDEDDEDDGSGVEYD